MTNIPRFWALNCENYVWHVREETRRDIIKNCGSIEVIELDPILNLLERVVRTCDMGDSPAGFSTMQDIRDLLRKFDRLPE